MLHWRHLKIYRFDVKGVETILSRIKGMSRDYTRRDKEAIINVLYEFTRNLLWSWLNKVRTRTIQ